MQLVKGLDEVDFRKDLCLPIKRLLGLLAVCSMTAAQGSTRSSYFALGRGCEISLDKNIAVVALLKGL